MSATIIDFPSYLFTASDLEHLRQLASDMIGRGLWDSCERHTGEGALSLRYDRWLIFTDALSDATFSIERRSTGRYVLADARSGAALGGGRTIQEVTRRWTAALAV
jgi:hypothetical protein